MGVCLAQAIRNEMVGTIRHVPGECNEIMGTISLCQPWSTRRRPWYAELAEAVTYFVF